MAAQSVAVLRVVFVALVVVNLLLIGFRTSSRRAADEPPRAEARTETEDIPTIHLFSEIVRDQHLLATNRRCFTLGPLRTREDLLGLREDLREISVSIGERHTEALVEKGYWLFFPPYESLPEANRALRSLRALGVEDVAVVREGEWARSVSLGYYLRRENALRMQKRLEERGLEPQLRVRRQAEPRYWLDYEQAPGAALFAPDAARHPAGLAQRAMPCPEQGFTASLEGAEGAEVAEGAEGEGQDPAAAPDEAEQAAPVAAPDDA